MTERKPILKSLFIVGSDNKLAVISLSFLIWMMSVTACWIGQTIHDKKMAELPPTVVHLTLALGSVKVGHRIAEGKWETIITKLFNRKKKKINKKTSTNK